MAQQVLFLDDEQMVLESINRTLHRESYEVKTVNNGEEALKILVQLLPSVIVTDMSMPYMDGNEFLSKAQKICPDSVYMVLSAYSDIEKIMNAVNEQHVWRYITKPWHNEDLKLAIQNAIEIYEHRKEKKNLLLKLEKQNTQLLEMNNILEKKVQERTIQLKEKNEILQLLVEDSDIGLILEKVCNSVSLQLNNSPVYIDVPFLNKTYTIGKQEFTASERNLSDECIDSKKEIVSENGLCIPLIKNEKVLGTIIIKTSPELSNTILSNTKESFGYTAILCLAQAWNLQQIDKMMDEI